ncbi:MAG: YihA family ribosome biogenesis GTP-binding protein [Actinomycetia bacterium]|nr:YihA family ribosome biogenesis GTP-binding protein [Actinomycetes bacterium]MCP4963283.1 YihA family ribosome biogenesis GTP-binding protein [Actinomycetes bacterium]
MSNSPLPLRFLQSAAKEAQLPESVRELALVGRSNVGKSSLLNALANRKNLARTSKSPGATKLINVFELESAPRHWLVDLPGYGYAKVSPNERKRWQAMIEGYLTGREQLVGVILLIDGEVGPTALDLQTQEWLTHIGLPIIYVATKHDKIKSSRLKTRKRDLTAKLGQAKGVSWVSASKGTGMAELRRRILVELLEH